MISALSNVSMEEIHDAFLDAFSNYEIKVEISREQLEEMLKTRSYNKELSLGYFDGPTLAGFIFVGHRTLDNRDVFYDAGTGVRQSYQGKGLGKLLIEGIKSVMAEKGVSLFILEVLENNTPAQELYKKYGFSISRKLNCYEIPEISAPSSGLTCTSGSSIEPGLDFRKYCSFSPSWQNAWESYKNVSAGYNVIQLRSGSELRAYGIVHKESGSVLQVGIAPEYRTKEILANTLCCLRKNTESSILKYLNVEDGSAMDSLFKELEIKKIVSQYEMIFEIKP